jgi:hypothetical protein
VLLHGMVSPSWVHAGKSRALPPGASQEHLVQQRGHGSCLGYPCTPYCGRAGQGVECSR